MMKRFNTYLGLFFCLMMTLSCAEEKQYSHREEIITEKIWKEDSLGTLLWFETPTDSLSSDSSLLSSPSDSLSSKFPLTP